MRLTIGSLSPSAVPPLWFAVAAVVCCLFVAGWSAATRRRQIRHWPGVFRCKVRIRTGALAGFTGSWPRTCWYAVWIHHVLLVVRRPTVPRFVPVMVRSPLSAVVPAPREFVGLGTEAVMVVLRSERGAVIEVAARSVDRGLLIAPWGGRATVAATTRTDTPRHDGPQCGSLLRVISENADSRVRRGE